MNPADVLGLNPRPLPKVSHAPASAPEAADWLKHPAKLVERVSLAMRLAAEPEWLPGMEPEASDKPAGPVVTNEQGGILLD